MKRSEIDTALLASREVTTYRGGISENQKAFLVEHYRARRMLGSLGQVGEALNFKTESGTLVRRFNTLTGVYTGGTTPSVQVDTSLTDGGEPTVRCVSSASNFVEIGDHSLTASTMSGVVAVKMYVRDWTKLHSCILYVGNASYVASFQAQQYFSAVADKDLRRNGWHTLYFYPTLDRTDEPRWVAAGGATWGSAGTSMTQIKLRVTPMTGEVADFNIATITKDAKSLGKILLFVDDGWIESYTQVHRYCAPRRVRVNYGIISDLVGTTNYVTESMLTDMYDSGYADFATHGALVYGVDSTALVKAELLRSREWLKARGWDRAADYIVWPAGKYDQDLIDWAISNGFTGARTIARNYCGTPLGTSSFFTAPASINMNTGTTISEANARLAAVASNGATIFTVGHRYATAGDASLTWAIADFQSYVDTIVTERAAGRVDDMFISDWMNNMVEVTA